MILLFSIGREYDFTERGGTGVISSDAAFFCLLGLFRLSGFRLLRFSCGSQGDGIFLHIGLVAVLRDAVDAVYQNDSSDGGIQTAVVFFRRVDNARK